MWGGEEEGESDGESGGGVAATEAETWAGKMAAGFGEVEGMRAAAVPGGGAPFTIWSSLELDIVSDRA